MTSMDLTIESAEWALVRGSLTETFTECDLSAAYPVLSTVRHLLSGNYHAVLSSVTARELFATDASEVAIEDLDTWFRSRLSNALVEASVETKFQILSIGIACLYSFIQGAWTGPLLPFKATDLLPIAASSTQEGKSRSKLLGWLMSDYEEAYALTNEPILLLLARWILVDAAKEFKDFKTMGWWTYRCAFIQQRIIENHAITLQDIIVDSLDEGKRTKFQTFDATQLIVVAESRRGATVPLESASTPITLDHNDDTLLEKLKITDKNAAPQHNLSVVDQCILLAFCLNVKNTNPIHGLTTEEMFPYVRRVLDHPNNWMVHTMGLLLRCRLEMAKSRTAERSVLQLQALVDQFTVLDSTVSERMEHIFSIMLPSKWELERELGERFVSLGVIRSAMEIFERLEMWEDVVSCHIMLEEPSKAEVIVIELLKTSPNSPKFLCLLGDIKGDIQYYMKAWEVSGNRYARSMRSLGAHYFKKENMEKCVECYQLALALNPLFENSWFVLGCAAMKIENFDIAERAFNRVTVIDPDNGEAWNNLASVYIKGKKLREAFNCLKESLKHNYDASNIWENYLFVSVDIGEFSESIRAIDRVLMIRVDKPRFKDSLVDFDILDIVMLAIINGQLDSQGRAADYLAPKMAKLLETITSKLSTPRLFLICARFEQYQQHLKLALEYYQKAHRAILHHPDLATNASIFKSLVQYTIHVADAYVELGPQEEENTDGRRRGQYGM
ncbi:hypothetical protein BASA83_007322 [Batrachochytrium salamandrivorans]|nr:hypothetical protein BASA83_007322 [Batrachochytrium salamandrivorans]